MADRISGISLCVLIRTRMLLHTFSNEEAMTTPAELEFTKVRFGFRSSRQTPLFMVWREYWYQSEVVYATVLFNSMDWIGV